MKENQASSTAFFALQSVLYTARYSPYSHLVSAEVVEVGEQILAASAEGKKYLNQLGTPLFQLKNWILDQIIIPRLRLHIALRKCFIEDVTIKAIQSGVTQVINLGAGFDTLMWRIYTKYPTVNFIEIDHPATSASKKQALLGLDKRTPSNLHFVSVDFSKQNLNSVLESFDGCSKKRRTLFICEAVLMYLEHNDIVQLLSSLKDMAGPESLLVLSCVEPMSSSNNDTSPLLKLYLKLKGEMLNWCVERQNLGTFLEQQNYRLKQLADAETFDKLYLNSKHKTKLHQSEFVAVAQVND